MKTEYVVGDKVVVLHSDYENFTIGKEYEVKQLFGDDLIGLTNNLGCNNRFGNEPWAFYYHEVAPTPNSSTKHCPLWSDDKDLNSIINCVENGEIKMVTVIVNLWEDILCLKEEVELTKNN